jgi:hypothetical protein
LSCTVSLNQAESHIDDLGVDRLAVEPVEQHLRRDTPDLLPSDTDRRVFGRGTL